MDMIGMPSKYLFVTLFSIIGSTLGGTQAHSQTLHVSNNHRYIVKADNTPFFWLGDTVWELFHRSTREEALRYLINRKDKGFTVVQAVILAEFDGLNTPNAYGETPLVHNDPRQPNEKYFQYVDYIVHKADSLGLYIGMLPSWGDKWNKKWGVGPEIFTPDNARSYGKFLGSRYRDDNIIWILGGDRNPENQEDLNIINALAEGLEQGDGGSHLMTYHPQGESHSSQWFQKSKWLDFNMFQSGHGAVNTPNFKMTLHDYRLKPVKPVLDGEPNYEDHPIAWNADNGWFTAFDVRQAAYWSMLAGAMGHTYGDHAIWQLWEPGRDPISSVRTPWYEALDYPGAFQMTFMKNLFLSRPFFKMHPAENLISGDILRHTAPARAALADDHSFALVYIPHGQNLTLHLAAFKDKKANAWWYNPRLGKAMRMKSFEVKGDHSFNPPADRKRGNDWVLVIDDASAGYTPPGNVSGH